MHSLRLTGHGCAKYTSQTPHLGGEDHITGERGAVPTSIPAMFPTGCSCWGSFTPRTRSAHARRWTLSLSCIGLVVQHVCYDGETHIEQHPPGIMGPNLAGGPSPYIPHICLRNPRHECVGRSAANCGGGTPLGGIHPCPHDLRPGGLRTRPAMASCLCHRPSRTLRCSCSRPSGTWRPSLTPLHTASGLTAPQGTAPHPSAPQPVPSTLPPYPVGRTPQPPHSHRQLRRQPRVSQSCTPIIGTSPSFAGTQASGPSPSGAPGAG